VPAKLDQVAQLVVVVAACHDRVDLEPGEACPPGRLDAREHARERIEPGQSDESVAPQRIEAHCEPMKAGRLEIGGLRLEQYAVGREREVPQPGSGRQLPHEHRDVTAEQRLAARQPDPIDPHFPEELDEPANLFKRQDVLARQPEVLVLRHAVVAAQVAPVGDRQPEAPQRAAEGVEDWHRAIIGYAGYVRYAGFQEPAYLPTFFN
jgi:hypothetical protein